VGKRLRRPSGDSGSDSLHRRAHLECQLNHRGFADTKLTVVLVELANRTCALPGYNLLLAQFLDPFQHLSDQFLSNHDTMRREQVSVLGQYRFDGGCARMFSKDKSTGAADRLFANELIDGRMDEDRRGVNA